MVHILLVPALTPLYLYVSIFRSKCAVPNMAVFCSSLTSWFPCMLLTYFLYYFDMVPVAPIITGITFVFTFHMRCISIVRSLYFRIFSASFLITCLSPEIATSMFHTTMLHTTVLEASGLTVGEKGLERCWSWSGRPRPTTLLPPRSNGKTRGC